ncbi:hypothetical protein H6763_01725 [Candidatus Nomurabacteria bacterium]|nr:hypothetical protein [Candidatus Nomurabacteria bacterium]MCB9803526.1 hypothetical protein [Candidatus Nomurabacteria bacterium]
MKENRRKVLNGILSIYTWVGIALLIFGVIVVVLPLAPGIVYSIYPSAYDNELDSLTDEIHIDPDSIDSGDRTDQELVVEAFPAQDLALPTTPQLKITKIGVNGTLQQGSNGNDALSKGPWIVPDLGDPMNNYLPTIIASHRWGGIGWSSEQRELLSFNKLPDLVAGDTIQIVWDQRVFEYQVIRVVESTYIDDYNTDLILYTCKYLWQNPTRIFVYAERSN